MAIEELKKELGRVRSAIERYREYLDENEWRTRIFLIDPILVQLGWNVMDPDRVQLEVKANGNRIDYVLSKEGIKNYAVVEAKKSGAGLAADRKQATGYAVEIGARYVLLTNGLRWEAWEVKSGSPRKNSTIAEINVTTGDVGKIANSLQRLSYDALGA